MSLMGGSLLLLSLLYIAGSVDSASGQPPPNLTMLDDLFSDFAKQCYLLRSPKIQPMSSDWLETAFADSYAEGNKVCNEVAKLGDDRLVLISEDAKKLITDFMWTVRENDFEDVGISRAMASLFYHQTKQRLSKIWGRRKGESSRSNQ